MMHHEIDNIFLYFLPSTDIVTCLVTQRGVTLAPYIFKFVFILIRIEKHVFSGLIAD